jgi:hypothetical protein
VVLLGDVVELRQGPLRDALAAASRVLVALASSLRSDVPILLVPGNHDHHLLNGWWARRAEQMPPPLGLEDTVDWIAGEPLARLADALAPAQLEVRYPGVWLRDDVYATHGHYLDRHTTVPMSERLGAAAMAKLQGLPLERISAPDDYEAVLGPMYAWIHAVAQVEVAGWSGPSGFSRRAWRVLGGGTSSEPAPVWAARRLALSLGFMLAIEALNVAGLGPLAPDITMSGLRRAGTRAFGQVLEALDVHPEHAIFGHTHRAGPLPGDDLAEWVAPGGALLHNSGCWTSDHDFAGTASSTSPYRPGFCVWVDQHGPPRLVNLLDEPEAPPRVLSAPSERDAAPGRDPERPGRPARA